MNETEDLSLMDHKLNICNKKDCSICNGQMCQTTYIYDAFSIPLIKKDIHDLIFYAFNDVNISKIQELENTFNSISNGQTSIPDSVYITETKKWYDNIKPDEFYGFEPIFADNKVIPYFEYKVKEIIDTIGDYLPKIDNNSLLVDVGAGDCHMSRDLGNYLKCNVAAVDIPSSSNDNDVEDAINWTSSANQTDACKNTSDSQNGTEFKHIMYDGSDLVSAVKNEFANKNTVMIMYNHALHHFGNINNIKYSLKQSFDLCSEGGILFIREHDMNKVSSVYLNLQHLFLQLRAIIKLPLDNILKKTNYFMKTYSSDFFTKKDLIKWCREVGYTFENVNLRKSNHYIKNSKNDCIEFSDVSKTIFLCFVKKTVGGKRKQSKKIKRQTKKIKRRKSRQTKYKK